MNKTLEGIRVLEIADLISGPYCGMLLAGLGATVTKIEPPEGGDSSRKAGPFLSDVVDAESSGLYHYLNRSKQGITLDFKKPTGYEILRRLLGQADVLIEDLSPRLAKRLKLDYAHLSQLNPKLIVVSITPFGLTGPYRDYRAYPINASAMGGMSLTVGEPNREPLTPPFSMGCYQTGIVAANSVMCALFARDPIGEGQLVDVAEVEAWAVFHTGNVLSAFVYRGQKRIRAGHRTPAPYPYTILPCKDGYIFMIALRGGQWKPFLEIVGGGKVPDWYESDPRFQDRAEAGRKYADELDRALAPWLMAHTRQEIFELCRQNHVPFAPVRAMDEVVNDEHLAQRGFFASLSLRGQRKVKCPGAPIRFSASPWALAPAGPCLGEHNGSVYKRLGYTDEELAEFRRTGVI